MQLKNVVTDPHASFLPYTAERYGFSVAGTRERVFFIVERRVCEGINTINGEGGSLAAC